MPAAAPAPAKPTYQQLVTGALGDYKKQSAQAILKEVAAKRGENDQNKCRHFVKLTLKRMVEKKLVQQVKGQGANGSFKLLKAAVAVPKKAVKKVKKAPAKKVVKKTVAKKVLAKKAVTKKAPKPSGAKKPAAKKAAAKKAPAKAPKAAAAAKKAPTKKVIKAAAKAYRAAPVASAKKAKK